MKSKASTLDLGPAVTERLKAIRRTKLYDLFAATPLIAFYALCAADMMPSVAQQIALVKLFVQTDPSFLPAESGA